MQNNNKQTSNKKTILRAEKLINLIDYQDNSVVSKTIINKETGTITLFAFDENQGLSEHTTPFDAFIYLVDGKAKVTISNKEFQIEKGQTITLPANQPHSLKGVKKFKMILIMIKS